MSKDAQNAPLDEESGGTLKPDPELEEALREAAESVDTEIDAGLEDIADLEVLSEHDDLLLTEEPPNAEADRLRKECAEHRDRLVRLQADFENFRRRAAKEKTEALQYGHQNLVKDILPTVDNLDRAIEHAGRSEGAELESLLQGVQLVRRELISVLAQYDVTEIEALGEAFDPMVHEAMAQTPDGSVPPNTIVDVFQKGYLQRDRLLRPARVIVAKAPDDEPTAEESKGSAKPSGSQGHGSGNE